MRVTPCDRPHAGARIETSLGIVNQLEIVGHEKRIPDGILTKLRKTLPPRLISGGLRT